MHTTRVAVAGAVAMLAVATGSAQTTTDQAAKTPWSASYYPQSVGALYNGYLAGEPAPLQKYDQYTAQGTQAADWEKAARPSNVPGWFGYCHAWSAASILADEPQFSRYGKGIVFRVGDLKGLLMPLYYVTLTTGIGERCYDPPGECNKDDPTPIEFEGYVLGYIGGQYGTKTAVVMDKHPGSQVWNQPLYKYTRTEQKTVTAGGWAKKVKIDVEYALEFSDYDQAGTSAATATYYYTLEDTNNNNKADKSQWTDPTWTTKVDAPLDFLWHPTMIASGPDPNINPYVKASDVAAMMGLPKVGLLARDTSTDKGIQPSTGASWQSPDLWTVPPQPQPGQGVALHATVHNQSGLDLTGVTVRFYRSAPNLGSMDPALLGGYKVGEVSDVAIGHYLSKDVQVSWVTPANVSSGDGCILVTTDHSKDPLASYYPANDNNVAARNFFVSTLTLGQPFLDFPFVMLNPSRLSFRSNMTVALDSGTPGWTVSLVGPDDRTTSKRVLAPGSPVPFGEVVVRPDQHASYRLRVSPPIEHRAGDSVQISVSSHLVWSGEKRKPETNGITLQVNIAGRTPPDR